MDDPLRDDERLDWSEYDGRLNPSFSGWPSPGNGELIDIDDMDINVLIPLLVDDPLRVSIVDEEGGEDTS